MMERRLNQYYIQILDEHCKLTVHWLRFARTEEENLLTYRNKHRFYELQYVLDGQLDFCLSERTFSLHSGQFILVTPGNYHEITGFSPNTRKMIFGFDAELCQDSLNCALREKQCAVQQESPLLRHLADALAAFPPETSAVSGVQLQCLTEAFFFTLLQLILPRETNAQKLPQLAKHNYQQELTDRVYAYIQDRLGSGFATVEELAQAFHMSARHLSRICKMAVNKTTREILDEERLRYIRMLLSTTAYSLDEIAFLAGFTSEQSLVRFFKAKEGYTPGQYRKYSMLK